MRLWATVLLVLSVLLVVVEILVTVVGEDPTAGAAGALFFTACAINFAVMRLDASKGEKWWSLMWSLGRSSARTTALVISFIFWIGAGVLIVMSEDLDPGAGWIAIAFGATGALVSIARLVDARMALGLLGCAGFIATGVVILRNGGPPWIGWLSIIVFGGMLVMWAVHVLRGAGRRPAK